MLILVAVSKSYTLAADVARLFRRQEQNTEQKTANPPEYGTGSLLRSIIYERIEVK